MTDALAPVQVAQPTQSGNQLTKLRRGGAPKRNKNAIRHGLMTTALPPGCTGVRKSVNKFRQAIEKIVAENLGGEISVLAAATINSASRWEQHALLANRWLRIHFAELNHDQRLAYSREVARASSERDKCL